MKFVSLALDCKKSRELIDLSHQISFFHGKISVGKSSIARLIDFCLGGDLEKTPALSRELVSATLTARMNGRTVLFQRPANGSSQVQVSWSGEDGDSGNALVPIHTESTVVPVWGNDVYCLSDVIFHLLDVTPIKVRKSKQKEESELVRLSFRDILFYCYLQQDHLDSSFFHMEDAFRKLKSRDVMRFVTGFYTMKMNELQVRLDELRTLRNDKAESAKQQREFLSQFGYESNAKILKEVEQVNEDLDRVGSELHQVLEGKSQRVHLTDSLRGRLRQIGERLATEVGVLSDLEERIMDQEKLKAELVSAKLKLARSVSASSVLSGVSFEACPACGARVTPTHSDACLLCGRPPERGQQTGQFRPEVMDHDLTARIEELNESIQRHSRASMRQRQLIEEMRSEKTKLDEQLNVEMSSYDSTFLSQSRELERTQAMLEERLRGLRKIQMMPKAVAELEEEADRLSLEIESVRRDLKAEEEALSDADDHIKQIEEAFLQSLLRVGFPGVSPLDRIEINRTTWEPIIHSAEQSTKWGFQCGSGGKKTLFNVCYALAVHRVAAQHHLPLPEFLIVDSPMKNISSEVNKEMFEAFYEYLYDLSEGVLKDTQFIIIDNQYVGPSSQRVDVMQRYMTTDPEYRAQYPPLISYYTGP